MFKFIKDFTPWYLNPSILIEIVPEIIKDNSNRKSPEVINKNFKIGLEEITYGLALLFLLFIIRVNL